MEALTAILAFPLQTLMIAVAVGTGVGVNSLPRGVKGRYTASSVATHGVVLAFFS